MRTLRCIVFLVEQSGGFVVGIGAGGFFFGWAWGVWRIGGRDREIVCGRCVVCRCIGVVLEWVGGLCSGEGKRGLGCGGVCEGG